jgi:DNA-binding transcriptional MerR regulator/DNA-directed RNA polymerase subunit RPC12/RpoP
MPKYATGEVAKMCGITVRTVQFYDNKGLLHPSELSDGGRRLYSDKDVDKMRLICLLRQVGLSIASVKKLLSSPSPDKVLLTLLEEQEKQLDSEIAEHEHQKATIAQIKSRLQGNLVEGSQEFGIEDIMVNKSKLRRLRWKLVAFAAAMIATVIAARVVFAFTGAAWVCAAAIVVILLLVVLMVRMYYKDTMYICPECKTKFKPGLMRFMFAGHTLKTRRLTCPKCGYHGPCIEAYNSQEN